MRVSVRPFQRAGLAVAVFALTIVPLTARAGDETTAAKYGGVLRTFNPALTTAISNDIAAHVLLMSFYYNLDPRLIVAIVGVESSWHTHAVSSTGAQGLGQLMPATANTLGVLGFDTYENIDGTARYLRRMSQQFANIPAEKRWPLALASYNAGPGAVARYNGIPPYAETRAYVAKVMSLWNDLRSRLPGAATTPPVLARITVRAAEQSRGVVRHLLQPAVLHSGSVASFTALDADSMREYLAYETFAKPSPTPERKTLKRWFARAFGVANR